MAKKTREQRIAETEESILLLRTELFLVLVEKTLVQIAEGLCTAVSCPEGVVEAALARVKKGMETMRPQAQHGIELEPFKPGDDWFIRQASLVVLKRELGSAIGEEAALEAVAAKKESIDSIIETACAEFAKEYNALL